MINSLCCWCCFRRWLFWDPT
uniref:Scarecrow-like protein 15 n=1 Tax=Rhizophora mucronata TaxID=61149 RepID=A0A2P2IU02_RHIMU